VVIIESAGDMIDTEDIRVLNRIKSLFRKPKKIKQHSKKDSNRYFV